MSTRGLRLFPARLELFCQLVLVCAFALLFAQAINPAPASATLFANEYGLRDVPTGHRNYMLDPGAGQMLEAGDFLASSPFSFFQVQAGFDRNFLVWAPIDRIHVDGSETWNGCNAVHGPGLCWSGWHFNTVGSNVADGMLTVKHHGSAWISLVCGNWNHPGAGPMPTISGVKYDDRNANGHRDSGEPGIAGWNMHLYYNGSYVTTTQTNASGAYSLALNANAFPQLRAGSYQVVEEQRAGWHQLEHPGPDAVAIAIGAHNFGGNNFGNYRDATKSGTIVEDMNADGDRDADDPGVAGWTVYVDEDGDGSADPGEPSAVTAADDGQTASNEAGTYKITGIKPSDATRPVRVVGQAGWICSLPAGSCTHSEVFHSGADLQSNDFGFYRDATKSGTIVEDMNADGDRDADDPGVAGWTVYVDEDGDGSADPGEPSAVTAADDGQTASNEAGTYKITGIKPSDATRPVRVVGQAGWICSLPANSSCDFSEVFLSNAEHADNDFGFWRPAQIVGAKWHDANVDGVQQPDEQLLTGWAMSVGDPGSSVTNELGEYSIGDLKPGVYTLAETQQAGWRPTNPSSGAIEGIELVSNQVQTENLGNVCLAGVTPVAFDSSNGNEAISGLETRIEEVSVEGILENDPALPLTGTSGSAFAGLLPGTYRVTVFLGEGVYSTDPDLVLVDGRWAIVKQVTLGACEAPDVTVTVFTGSSGKVTGGIRLPDDSGKITAGFEFQTRPDGSVHGTLQHTDHDAPLNLHTDRIDGIRVEGQTAHVWGWVSIDGVSRQFLLVLVDAGEPGTSDRYEFTVVGYNVGVDVTRMGGNVQIHRK